MGLVIVYRWRPVLTSPEVLKREDAAMSKELWEHKSIQSILDMDQFQMKDYIGELRQSALEGDVMAVVLSTINDLAQCEEDLLLLAGRIERDLASMREYLEAGWHTNQSGVLQRAPVELDMLCLKRSMLIENLKRLLYTTKKMGVKS